MSRNLNLYHLNFFTDVSNKKKDPEAGAVTSEGVVVLILQRIYERKQTKQPAGFVSLLQTRRTSWLTMIKS